MTALFLGKMIVSATARRAMRPGWWILPALLCGSALWFQIGKAMLH